MIATARPQRTYDHRLKNLVYETGDIQVATSQGVPRSTARGWLHLPRKEVVTLDIHESQEQELRHEVMVLRRRICTLLAVLRLVLVLLRVSGFTLARCRLRDGDKKAALLKAIERARAVLPLRAILRVLKLSSKRYHTWKRTLETCGNADSSPALRVPLISSRRKRLTPSRN